MPDDKYKNFVVEVTTGKHIHRTTYAHKNLSEVVKAVLDRPMFINNDVQRMKITQEAKKSTKASEKSEKNLVAKAPLRSPPLTGQVITEQGIVISFGSGPIKAFPIGPL